MFEIAQDLEQVATGFRPIVLIGPGIACVIVGLFIWLGGLGLRRFLIGIVGAVCGAAVGFFVIADSVVAALVLAGAAALIAIVLERVFITAVAGILIAIIALTILAPRHSQSPDAAHLANPVKPHAPDLALDARQAADAVQSFIVRFLTEAANICLKMPAHKWAVVAGLVVLFTVAGFFLWRLTSAFCCAALGTMLIFTGMISLLLYKGAAPPPITAICRNPSFYGIVFLLMTTFGTAVQLLLCRPKKPYLVRKKKADKGDK